jgi:hypothetical protein
LFGSKHNMLRSLKLTSKVLLAAGRSGAVLPQHGIVPLTRLSVSRSSVRGLSSFGNPMFPHRATPDLATLMDEKEKQRNDDGPTGDFLADHGGKITFAVFGLIAGLIYTYYESGQDRNRVEDGIADSAILEPMEIQDLRLANEMSVEVYYALIQQTKEFFPAGKATYKQFLHFLKHDFVLPESYSADESSSPGGMGQNDSPRPGRKTASGTSGGTASAAAGATGSPPRLNLKAMHFLDRLVMGYTMKTAAGSGIAAAGGSGDSGNASSLFDSTSSSGATTEEGPTSSSSSAAAAAAAVYWADTPLDVEMLLVMLNLVMAPEFESRIDGLYLVGRYFPVSGTATPSANDSGSSTESNAASYNDAPPLVSKESSDRFADTVDSSNSSSGSHHGNSPAQQYVNRETLLKIISCLIDTDQVLNLQSRCLLLYLILLVA